MCGDATAARRRTGGTSRSWLDPSGAMAWSARSDEVPNASREAWLARSDRRRLHESYVNWREGCADVHTAYRRWALSEPRDRDLAFMAYRAALDREEKAALAYELIAEQLARRAHH
jgi:hypothetical protein